MSLTETDREFITLTVPRRALVKALADLSLTVQLTPDADIETLCDQIEASL